MYVFFGVTEVFIKIVYCWTLRDNIPLVSSLQYDRTLAQISLSISPLMDELVRHLKLLLCFTAHPIQYDRPS